MERSSRFVRRQDKCGSNQPEHGGPLRRRQGCPRSALQQYRPPPAGPRRNGGTPFVRSLRAQPDRLLHHDPCARRQSPPDSCNDSSRGRRCSRVQSPITVRGIPDNPPLIMPGNSEREEPRGFGPLVRFLVPGLLLVFAAGCATLHPTAPAPPSFAFEHPESTRLGRALAPAQQRHPGESGFGILEYGLESLVARAALADAGGPDDRRPILHLRFRRGRQHPGGTSAGGRRPRSPGATAAR